MRTTSASPTRSTRECLLLTSASLMVRRPAARSGAASALASGVDLGLHLELGEWRYRGQRWESVDEVPAELVESEIESQLEAFRDLVGAEPTHLDSHQHVHLREPARAAAAALATRLKVPLRHLDARVRYCGEFYGQTERGEPLPEHIGVDALIRVVATLGDGVTELCCHPARGGVPMSGYDRERVAELAALCDPRVRAAVDQRGVRLTTFRDVVA
jgi:predicted glycoside hydrolase/deacetylase ChbG (UPF0249 family)